MKPKSIQDFTYKHSVNRVMHPNLDVFDFYKAKDKLGTLVCHKSEIPIRPNYDKSVLAIDFLEVADKGKGNGTKILKFAQEYSERVGCRGFMTVKSDTSFTPDRIPHIFYRKFGFSSFEKDTDKKLDRFIKQKTNATKEDFPCLVMHYPPQAKPQTGVKKLWSYLKHLL